eukprot:11415421-Alexandrium_andersonii.AAC.1
MAPHRWSRSVEPTGSATNVDPALSAPPVRQEDNDVRELAHALHKSTAHMRRPAICVRKTPRRSPFPHHRPTDEHPALPGV